MLNKKDYLNDKKKIKYINKQKLIIIMQDAGLNDYEKRLVLYLQSNETRIKTCYELSISERKYQDDMKRALSKLHEAL